MRSYLTIFAVLIAVIAFGQSDKRLKGVEKELNLILETTKAPGFAVAVVEKDKIIYAKGFGYSNFEKKIPANANTLFAIGSVTKSFTSAIIGQLEDEGELSLEDSPIDYIPELRFYNSTLNSNLQIKDLMCHRTGIPRHDYSWYLFPTESADSLIGRMKYQEPFAGLREQWYYNNFMFLTQGVIAERITGKSWGDNIKERFFNTLGMSNSNLTIDEMEKANNAAHGYELKNDSIIKKMAYYNIAAMSPAGSINSSVNEMANWLITWIYGGKFNGEQIIPAAYARAAMSSQMVVGGALPGEKNPGLHISNYGYGWFISSYKGHYRVQHGGNIDGFSANAAFYPSDSVGIVVLTNQNGSSVPSMVRNTIADRMLQTDKSDWVEWYNENLERAKKAEQEKEEAAKSSPVPSSHNLFDFTGEYSNPGYGKFVIEMKNDSLFAKFKLMTMYLKHEHYDIFEPFEVSEDGIDTTDTGSLRFNFETSNSGDISSVNIKMEGSLDHPIEFDRKPNSIEVSVELMASYTGDFDLSGTEIKMYEKNGSLYLFIPGQPEYELIATEKHKFSIKILDGYKLEYIDGDDGSLNELKIIQPNGTFKATRK